MVHLFFIFLGVAAAVEDSAVAGGDPCATAGIASEKCVDEDGATHLLQMTSSSIRGAHAQRVIASDAQTPAVTKTNGFSCQKYNNPVQMLKGKKGFEAKELNTKKGTYSTIFDVPYGRVQGGFDDLNACGVNPLDARIYCHMKVPDKSYIVRLDEKQVEFVAIVPSAEFNTGGFSEFGDMFVATGNSEFIVVPDLNATKGYSTKSDTDLLDLTEGDKKLTLMKPKGFQKADDCVVVYQDLEKKNETGTYVLVLYGPMLQIAKWSGSNFSDTWIVDVVPMLWDNIYGAAWNFRGKVFFAADNGRGVYRIPLDDLDLANETQRLTLERVGDSDKNSNNDGFNCLNGSDPWMYGAGMVDCKMHRRPMQIIKNEDGYAFAELNFTSGNYTTFGTVYFNMTSPPFQALNSAGISPRDAISYGTLKLSMWPNASMASPFWIVRFNQYKIEYVAKVLGGGGRRDAIAGSFDQDGTYYVIANPFLYAFPNISNWTGFENWTDAGIAEFDQTNVSTFDMSKVVGNKEIADFVVVRGNLDGKGNASFLLAVNQYQDLAVVKLNLTDLPNSKSWTLKVNKVTGKGQEMNFGAAWSYDGNAYFAQNDGAGVFQLPMDQIILGEPGVQLEPEIQLLKVGESAPVTDNDGMNCYEAPDPFVRDTPVEK